MINSLKYIIRRWGFLKVYNSPFKRPSLKFYFGKIKHGTPYMLPRRWVKDKNKPGYKKAIPRKIGFDFVSLGWKEKWDEPRYEWGPMISFVFFKWQACLFFVVPEKDHYWECWLYYEYWTDKTKSPAERLEQCRKEFPCIWTEYQKGKEEKTICYYDLILKDGKTR